MEEHFVQLLECGVLEQFLRSLVLVVGCGHLNYGYGLQDVDVLGAEVLHLDAVLLDEVA